MQVDPPELAPRVAPSRSEYIADAPMVPAWEAETRSHQPLPSARYADWIRDPDFLHGRLRQALTRATDVGAAQGDDYGQRAAIELALLRMYIETLADEIRQYTPAADEFLTVLESVAPEVHWHRTPSGFGAFTRDLESAIRAARSLRIPEHEKPIIYPREWGAPIEGWSVTIYYTERRS